MPVTVPVTKETTENRRMPWLLQSLYAARVVKGWDLGTSRQINKTICCSKGFNIKHQGREVGSSKFPRKVILKQSKG